MQRYSQHGQDIWVFRALAESKTGFFIEMGAHDGVTISNTFGLEQIGWQGICIEPAHEPYSKLCQNRNCICVNALVAGKDRAMATFLDSSDGVSGIDDVRTYKKAGRSYQMKTRRMIDVLRQCRAPRRIDYFSLDVEGAEPEILADFPYDEYEVGIWTIEHNARSFPDLVPVACRICETLVQRGYRYVGDILDDGLFCLPSLFDSSVNALKTLRQ